MSTPYDDFDDPSGDALAPTCDYFPFHQLGISCPTKNVVLYVIGAFLLLCVCTFLLEQWHIHEDEIFNRAKEFVKDTTGFVKETLRPRITEPFTFDEKSKDSRLMQRKAWAKRNGYSDIYDSFTSEMSIGRDIKERKKDLKLPDEAQSTEKLKTKESALGKASSWGRAGGEDTLRSLRGYNKTDASTIAKEERRAKESYEKQKKEGKKWDETVKLPDIKPTVDSAKTQKGKDAAKAKAGQSASWGKAGSGKFLKKGDDVLEKAAEEVRKAKEKEKLREEEESEEIYNG